MKTYVVKSVRKLVRTSETSKLKVEGYIIEFVNPKSPNEVHTLFRRPKQVLTDLIGSERISSRVTDWEDRRVSNAMSRLVNKPFEAEITFWKAGETYVATPESSVITKPSHPMYGKYKVGDEVPREKDGCNIEGFINCRTTEAELDKLYEIEFFAERLAENRMQQENLFAGLQSAVQATNVEIEDEDEFIDEDILDEAEVA